IADLNEAEVPFQFAHSLLQYVAQGKRLQNAALQETKSARSGPGHAFQEAPTIDAVLIQILLNVFFHLLSVCSSIRERSVLLAPCLHSSRLNRAGEYSPRTLKSASGIKSWTIESKNKWSQPDAPACSNLRWVPSPGVS